MNKNIYFIAIIIILVGFIVIQKNDKSTFISCVADSASGITCSGCQPTSYDINKNYGEAEICLAKIPEGEIIGLLKHPANEESGFSSDVWSGKIIARDSSGKIAEENAEFGFDRIFRDINNTDGYFILSTNRENGGRLENEFDKLFLVTFGPDQPFGITKIIDKAGIGIYSYNNWLYIPTYNLDHNIANLTLETIDLSGEKIDEFKFGQILVNMPGYDSQMFISSVELLKSRDILVDFSKEFGEIYRRYIISPESKKITPAI